MIDWQGEKVLVTGGAGFIGSNLVDALVDAGAQVTVLDDLSVGKRANLERAIASGRATLVEGNILDRQLVGQLVPQVNVVLHLAVACLRVCFDRPHHVHEVNATGTLNLLEATQRLNPHIRRCVYVSSSEIYGTALRAPMDEHHPLVPTTVYGASKLAGELYTQAYFNTYAMPTVIVRPFNTYGPRQSGRAIIPTIITQLLAGQQEIKLGSLTPTRDFNYVKDTAHGFMAIADCDAAIGQEINIATGVEHSIGDLANELIAQINPSARIVCEAERLRPEKSEVNRLLGDATKLRELTGWAPQYTFEQGLAATIEFLRGNLDQYKVGQYIL